MSRNQAPYVCQHSFRLPGDAWQVEKQLGPTSRLMRCLLCRQKKVAMQTRSGGWKMVEQMQFEWGKE